VQRQNVAAWYVCENQTLWINLGAYLYGTPAGCADQTVSFLGFFFLRSASGFLREDGRAMGSFFTDCRTDPFVWKLEG
jgi:hypothetical protein